MTRLELITQRQIDRMQKLSASGMKPSEVAASMGVSTGTVQRYLKDPHPHAHWTTRRKGASP